MIFFVWGLIALLVVLLVLEWLAGTSVQNFKRTLIGAGVVLLLGVGVLLLVTGKSILSLPAFAGAGVLYSRIRSLAGIFGIFNVFRRMRGSGASGGGSARSDTAAGQQGLMSRAEAAKTLGVPENADASEVKKAHKALMQRLHPDAGGNDYLAAKLNEARDVMLK